MLKESAVALALGLFLAPTGAAAQEPFYKGKRLTVLINFAAGGGADIAGRLYAKHLARHIEGQPNVVVQNMDGAAGLNGANYLGEIASKDGTVVGHISGVTWQFVNEPERFRADLRKFEFIAFEPSYSVYYVRSDVPPGMKDATDIVRAEGLVAGGTGVHHARDLAHRLTLDMLGVPYRYVTGYRSAQTARLAFLRNEINFFSGGVPAYRSVVDSMVRAGQVTPLYFDPSWNGETLGVPKEVEGIPIMPFQELYQKVKGLKPSGQLWDLYLAVLALNSTMTRIVALPPDAPQAAIVALRSAALRLRDDKAFAEDAMRSIGYTPHYEAGPDSNRQARLTLTVRPEIRALVADYVKHTKR